MKHSNNAFFVVSKNLQNTSLTNQTLSQQLKLVELEKFFQKIQLNSKSASNSSVSIATNKDHAEHDFLVKNIKKIIEFNRNCERKLSRGLYVAYLKTQSSMELVKVMVNSNLPNILPCFKVRDNPNVTKEEWELIKSIGLNRNDYNAIFNELNYKFLSKTIESINQLVNQLGKFFLLFNSYYHLCKLKLTSLLIILCLFRIETERNRQFTFNNKRFNRSKR